MAVAGNYAYVADIHRGLRVVDVSTPGNPHEVGACDTPGWAMDVAVSGNYAYVADYYHGLRVVDISTPGNPREVGAYDTPGWAYGVAVAGNYAYVTDGDSGLWLVDVSAPGNPHEVGAYDTPGWAYGVAVSGNYAYVTDGDSGLRVVKFVPGEIPLVESVTACDTAGNCATATAVDSVAIMAQTAAQEDPPLDVFILDAPPLLESTDPFTITGWAFAENFLQALTVTVSSSSTPIYTQTWASGTVTETMFEAPWTPAGEGEHIITATASDWATATVSDTATVIVDTQPPTITIATTILTGTHYANTGQLDLSGLVTDTGGVESVEVDLTGFQNLSGLVGDNAWTAPWFTDPNSPLDGITVTVTVTATDVAGRTAQDARTITVDVVPPTPVTLTLTSAGSVITPGLTLRDISPTLTLTWTASSDGSGLDDYLVDWAIETTTGITHLQSLISNLHSALLKQGLNHHMQ